VSQNYRFYPALIAAADLIRSGALSRPLAATIDFRRHAPSESRAENSGHDLALEAVGGCEQRGEQGHHA